MRIRATPGYLKPQSMNRRSLLATILAAGVAPSIVNASSIMPLFVRRESGLIAPRFMGDLIRRTTAYELERDLFITRCDILVPSIQLQLGVDYLAYAGSDPQVDVVGIFDRQLRDRGLSWADVRPLQPFK